MSSYLQIPKAQKKATQQMEVRGRTSLMSCSTVGPRQQTAVQPQAQDSTQGERPGWRAWEGVVCSKGLQLLGMGGHSCSGLTWAGLRLEAALGLPLGKLRSHAELPILKNVGRWEAVWWDERRTEKGKERWGCDLWGTDGGCDWWK